MLILAYAGKKKSLNSALASFKKTVRSANDERASSNKYLMSNANFMRTLRSQKKKEHSQVYSISLYKC